MGTNPFLVVQSGLLPAFVSFTKLTTWCHNRHPSVSAEHEETLGLFFVFVFLPFLVVQQLFCAAVCIYVDLHYVITGADVFSSGDYGHFYGTDH